MTEVIKLPYFSREDDVVKYLGQYPYANLTGIDISSQAETNYLISEGIQISKQPNSELSENGERILVIEPHPDDFALSALGYVLNRISVNGASCKVLNLFSRTAVKNFPWKDKVDITEDELEQLRLEESGIAVNEYLGQEFQSMRLPLASLRGHDRLFEDRHHEPELSTYISEFIVELIEENEVDTVVLPIGIQGHIDHLVAHDATVSACRLLGGKVMPILYEDYPYARNKIAYSKRLEVVERQLGIQPFYVNADDYLDDMANMAIIYRSQFDDVNRDQMLAIIREDCRAISTEAATEGIDTKGEAALRYWKVI